MDPTRLHMITRAHDIARVNCRTCTYFLQKQNIGALQKLT